MGADSLYCQILDQCIGCLMWSCCFELQPTVLQSEMTILEVFPYYDITEIWEKKKLR